MSDTSATATPTVPEEEGVERAQRSNIAFPYVALDEAAEAARAIHENAGRECELAQLAAWIGTTPTSSKLRSIISAARMFGLIERHAKMVALTELGTEIVDRASRDAAAVEAFLSVPLYQRLYDEFSGRQLPPGAGLEMQMQSFGVTPKSAPRARQVFHRSATFAGFFRADRDRLVRPGMTSLSRSANPAQPEVPPPPGSDQGGEPVPASPTPEVAGPSDPLLRGLWSKLPADGPFSPEEQAQWLALAKLSLEMVYGADAERRGAQGHDATSPSAAPVAQGHRPLREGATNVP